MVTVREDSDMRTEDSDLPREDFDMQWTEPDFTEISLNMEVTAYVRTDGETQPLIGTRSEERESSSTRG